MHEIRINIDSCSNYHPPKIVITEDHKTLLDMPADEFVSWVKRARRKLEENNEGDVPSPDSSTPSGSLPAAGPG